MMPNVIPIEEKVKSWGDTLVVVETEGVNKITIKMLEREFKFIYTFIKKNSPLDAKDIFDRFPKFDVESILYDLRLMHLIYFKRKVK